MNKIYLLLLPLVLLFASCEDKDEKELDYLKGHPIIGSWEFVGYDIEIEADNKDIEDIVRNYIDKKFQSEASFAIGSVLTFKTTGKLHVSFQGYTGEIAYSIDGSKISLTDYGSDGTTTFSIKNDELRFIDDVTKECQEYIKDFTIEGSVTKVNAIEICRKK